MMIAVIKKTIMMIASVFSVVNDQTSDIAVLYQSSLSEEFHHLGKNGERTHIYC
jgi:hypothetical protein